MSRRERKLRKMIKHAERRGWPYEKPDGSIDWGVIALGYTAEANRDSGLAVALSVIAILMVALHIWVL